jgi:hypothetical protein
MSLENFIPEIWTARILGRLDRAFRFAQAGVMNRDYEGEIRQKGDTVRITSIGPVTVSNYSKNTDIAAPQEIEDAQMTLVINQAKYFNFAIDDVDRAQGNPRVMDEAMREASYALRNGVDQFGAALYTDVATASFIGSDASPKTDLGTVGKAYEYLVDLGTLLGETDTPEEGRFAIVPPWFHGLLLKDDRFVRAGTAATDAVLRNGQVGEAAGFTILRSNNVASTTSTTAFKVVAGHEIAWTFAQQITEVEAYRPERRFADAIKGLLLYGAKVVRPANLAVLVANRA